ncbi:MAG: 3-dehydroquinate synthase II [Nitrososphaeraceae archaeon]
MVKEKNKELIFEPLNYGSDLNSILESIEDISDIKILKIEPSLVKNKKRFKTIFDSDYADIIICKTLMDIKTKKSKNKPIAYYKKVNSNSDILEIESAAAQNVDYVIVDSDNWKIIPLENIIANLQKSNTKIFTTANNSEEVRTMFTVLELGVDGVILSTNEIDQVKNSKKHMNEISFKIQPCEIIDVKEVGVGERVCVDTVSIMQKGEGMLIGSSSNFLFLLHNESEGSSFTSPRPFRVNAGAVYCYTILPNGNTKYLSEVESGTEILVVNQNGSSRKVTVGRSKIETRPMKLIKGLGNGIEGTVIVQNAETIQFLDENGNLIPVTELKKGDKILSYYKPARGRHFGVEVNEYILEK